MTGISLTHLKRTALVDLFGIISLSRFWKVGLSLLEVWESMCISASRYGLGEWSRDGWEQGKCIGIGTGPVMEHVIARNKRLQRHFPKHLLFRFESVHGLSFSVLIGWMGKRG